MGFSNDGEAQRSAAPQPSAIDDPPATGIDRFRQLADAMPQIVWTADAQGRIDYANRALFDYVGETRRPGEPIRWTHTVHPEDAAGALSAWRAAVADGTPYTSEYRLRRAADGAYRWMLAKGEPVREAEGGVVQWCGTLTDVHDLKTSVGQVAALAQRLSATLESITDAFMTVDRDWRVNYFNAEAERLMGCQRDAVVGHVIWEVFPTTVGSVFEREYRRAMAERCTVAFEAASPTVNRIFEVRAYPSDEGLAVYCRDATQEHEARAAAQRREREALAEARARADILATLQEIASAERPIGDVLAMVAERAMVMAGAGGSEIELVEGDLLVCRAAAGSCVRGVGQGVRLDHSLGGQAVRLGTVQYAEDTETDPWIDREVCRRLGVRSVVVAPLRMGDQVIGVMRAASPTPGAFAQREITNLSILAESLGGVIERRRIAAALQVSEAQYRLLFEDNPHPMLVYEPDTLAVREVNRSCLAFYGYGTQEFAAMTIADLVAEEGNALSTDAVVRNVAGARTVGLLRRHRKKSGEVVDVELGAETITWGGRPARLVLMVDVTERESALRELERVSRAQRMLSACNETLIRAEAEALLLERICRITVEIGGYSLAWVGFAQDNAAHSVLPVAHAGARADFLYRVPLSWSPATLAGRGSVGRAIASGSVVVIEDAETDPSIAPWRDTVVRPLGFKGIVSLPLRNRERVFGVLCLYAPHALRIAAQELALLEELANDLAFGIDNLRARDEQRRLQQVVLKVGAAVSGRAGAAFFEQLVRNMVQAVGAQAGYVARLRGTPSASGGLQARTVAMVAGASSHAAIDHAVEGTPCETLLAAPAGIVVEPVVRPTAWAPARVMGLDACAYAGCRLDSAAGQPIGFLFVLFAEPLAHAAFVESTLAIFAARAAAELERQQSDQQIRDQASLLDKAQDAIIVRDLAHRVLFWNRSAERLYGWRADEAIGRSVADLLYRDPSAFQARTELILRRGEWTGEITQYRRDGTPISIEGRWTLVRDEDGQPKSILTINTDISQRKEAEREVYRLAFFDALTGLPNRERLMALLAEARQTSAGAGLRGALLFVNLDNFRALNETLGHAQGDLLLQQAARRIEQALGPDAMVARLGSDEFMVLARRLDATAGGAAQQATVLGQQLLEALSEPFRLGSDEQTVSSCIGIVTFLGEAVETGELLRQVHLALGHAKGAGRNSIQLFDPQLQAAVAERAALEADLRQALPRDELVLYYQPQVDRGERVLGAEALLRWRHPRLGMVSPARFIPLAEETGLIWPIGCWVVETACRQLAAWRERPETAGLTISVNVSPSQFRRRDFVDTVSAIVTRAGIEPRRLKLELTESLLVHDMEATIDKMLALKALGVGFSLDDFGTGYSSLAYLKRMPLDQLKIDQSFVRDVITDPNDAAIARTVIALGRSLGLTVIAEGVEQAAQRDFLFEHDCDAYQGYLFGRPVPVAELELLLANERGDGPARSARALEQAGQA